LTRGSIILRNNFVTKKMDGRVKPGHDDWYDRTISIGKLARHPRA